MTISSLIAHMRTREADLADSTITITRVGARGAFNETTASHAAPATTVVYAGAALVRPDSEAVAEAGGTSIEVSRYLVKVPADTAVELGDVVTVTASTHDAALVGLTCWVVELPADEWQITRRLHCATQTPRPAA